MLALCFYRRQDHRKTRRPGSIILISICWTETSAGFLYDRSGCIDTVSHCSNIGALRNDECLETLRSDGFPALKGLLVGCLEQHLSYAFSFTYQEGHPLGAADPRPSVVALLETALVGFSRLIFWIWFTCLCYYSCHQPVPVCPFHPCASGYRRVFQNYISS